MAEELKKEEQGAENNPQETKRPETPSVEELMAEIKALKEANEKQKGSISSACADAAEWKRKYRATLDENTRKEQEREETMSNLQKELKLYKDKDRVSTYAAKLVDAGFTVEQASTMAQSLPEGVGDEYFEVQKSFLQNQRQQIKTQSLNSQPNLPVGVTPSAADANEAEEANLRRWIGLKK